MWPKSTSGDVPCLLGRPGPTALPAERRFCYDELSSQELAPGAEMRRSQKVVSWVVYRTAVDGKPGGMNVVCEQNEWDALKLAEPGKYKLIKGGITNEGEAER